MSLWPALTVIVHYLLPAAALAVENAAASSTSAATAAVSSCVGSSQLGAVSAGRCSVVCRELAVIGACGNASSALCERVDLSLTLDCSRGRLDSNETLALSADRTFARFLPWVRVLNLGRSRLPLITGGHLGGFVGLTELSLLDVGASGFEPRALAGPGSSLRSLDLTFNRLGRLPVDLFADTSSLETLDLSDNPAGAVTENPDLMRPLANSLRTLRLSGLRLETLPVEFLQPLMSLDALHMARNRIKELDASSFLGLRFPFSGRGRLTLDFDSNEIETLGDFAFASLRLPLTLTLQHNRIQRPGFLGHPTVDSCDPCRWDSSSVNLYGNPLQCGCDLYNFTRVKVTAAAIIGVCSGPPGFERHLLYGWRFGHAHRAKYFEMAALSLCRDKWQWRDTDRAGNESASWQQFGAQYSCRCSRWFNPEREFLRESNCASVSRAAVHAHDGHGGQEHEHSDSDSEEHSLSAAAAASSAKSFNEKSWGSRFDSSASTVFFGLLATVCSALALPFLLQE